MAEKKKSTAQSSIEQINAQYGKLPPQAIEVEEAVLGALMLERDAYVTVADIIEARSFYKEEHQKIFEATVQGFTKRVPNQGANFNSDIRQTLREQVRSNSNIYFNEIKAVGPDGSVITLPTLGIRIQ